MHLSPKKFIIFRHHFSHLHPVHLNFLQETRRTSRRASALAAQRPRSTEIVPEPAAPVPRVGGLSTRSTAGRSNKKAIVVEVKTTKTPSMKSNNKKQKRSRKPRSKLTPQPEDTCALAPSAAALGNPVQQEVSQPLSPAVAIESAVELSLGSPPSPKAAAEKIIAPPSAHLQQGAVDFLPLLPRPAAHGFQKLLNRANMSQACSDNSEAFIIKGMAGAQVYSLLGALSTRGSMKKDGTLMATLASQRYLITDTAASVVVPTLLDMHDKNSANSWMMHLAAEPEKFSLYRDLTIAYHDGWDQAVKYASMGLAIDAAELCNSTQTKEDLTIEERAAVVVYIEDLVAGAQKAKAPLEQGCVAPADDANNRLLCVQVARLLIFALKIVVGLHVPEWMYVLVSDVEMTSTAFAVAMQEYVKPGQVVDYGAVYAAVQIAAERGGLQYSWCKQYLFHIVVEEYRGLVNPLSPV